MKKALSIVAVLALVAVLGVALVACIPGDPDKAKANLEEAGYEVSVAKASDGTGVQMGLELTYGEGCIATVNAVKGEFSLAQGADVDMVAIIYFKDSASAKAYWETVKDEEVEEGWVAKQSGKIVYAGTEAGVKAAG